MDNIIDNINLISKKCSVDVPIFGFGGVYYCKFKLNPPVAENKINRLSGISVPNDLIEFWIQANGVELFIDSFQGIELGGARCRIYTIEYVLNQLVKTPNYLPILWLRDEGEMGINLDRYNQKQSYLTYPGIEEQYFDFSFKQWLETYLACNGNPFWNLV